MVSTRTSPVLLLAAVVLMALIWAACSTDSGEESEPAFVPEILPLPEPPAGFDPIPDPPDNPTTPEKVALGRQLFFDARLSVDGSRSCYSCHQNQHGMTDGLPTAVGAAGKKLTRSSPPLWNIGYHTEFYWDGRSGAMEAQAKAAWTGGNMGAKAKVDDIVAQINAIPGYHAQFQRVFGSDATADNMMQAITAYERTFYCGDTAFDRFNQGDESAMSESAQRGWELFRGKADCGTCHAGNLLTDLEYHNVGVGMDASEPDVGRKKVTSEDKDMGAFKTPTLRNISRTAPYFHNGSKATLEEAVDFMLGGGYPNPYLDTENLKKVDVTPEEKSDLLAFLRSLDCQGKLEEPALP